MSNPKVTPLVFSFHDTFRLQLALSSKPISFSDTLTESLRSVCNSFRKCKSCQIVPPECGGTDYLYPSWSNFKLLNPARSTPEFIQSRSHTDSGYSFELPVHCHHRLMSVSVSKKPVPSPAERECVRARFRSFSAYLQLNKFLFSPPSSSRIATSVRVRCSLRLCLRRPLRQDCGRA